MTTRAPLERLDPFFLTGTFVASESSLQPTTALGFLARILVLATLPHARPRQPEFQRTNGRFTLSIQAPSAVGLPYGVYPRLLLAWINTEAVRTRRPRLVLGQSLGHFISRLGLEPITGKRGTASRLCEQMHRLFSSSIRCTLEDPGRRQVAGVGYAIASRHELWWSPAWVESTALWQSSVTLSSEFYREIVEHPVPVDLRALRALKRSSLALDLYAWLTYRLSYLEEPTLVRWEALRAQFGAEYARERDFRRKLLGHLGQVLEVYPRARVVEAASGLELRPSKPHVERQGGRQKILS